MRATNRARELQIEHAECQVEHTNAVMTLMGHRIFSTHSPRVYIPFTTNTYIHTALTNDFPKATELTAKFLSWESKVTLEANFEADRLQRIYTTFFVLFKRCKIVVFFCICSVWSDTATGTISIRSVY